MRAPKICTDLSCLELVYDGGSHCEIHKRERLVNGDTTDRVRIGLAPRNISATVDLSLSELTAAYSYRLHWDQYRC